jgi:hypothetical protein
MLKVARAGSVRKAPSSNGVVVRGLSQRKETGFTRGAPEFAHIKRNLAKTDRV